MKFLFAESKSKYFYKKYLNIYISYKHHMYLNNTKKNKEIKNYQHFQAKKSIQAQSRYSPLAIKCRNRQCAFLFVCTYVHTSVFMYVCNSEIKTFVSSRAHGRNTVVALTLALFAFVTLFISPSKICLPFY